MPVAEIDFLDGDCNVISRLEFLSIVGGLGGMAAVENIQGIERAVDVHCSYNVFLQIFCGYPPMSDATIVSASCVRELPHGPDFIIPHEEDVEMIVVTSDMDATAIEGWSCITDALDLHSELIVRWNNSYGHV